MSVQETCFKGRFSAHHIFLPIDRSLAFVVAKYHPLYSKKMIASSFSNKSARIGGGRVSCRAQRASPARAAPAAAAAALFSGWLRPFLPQQQPRNPVQAERDELLGLLLQPPSSSSSSGGGGGGAAAAAGAGAGNRANDLIDALARARLPFDERQLGGGAWVVVYTGGAPQLWRAAYGVAGGRRRGAVASQAFDPATRGAVNRVETADGKLCIEATGTYTPLFGDGGEDNGSSSSSKQRRTSASKTKAKAGARLPQAVRADIATGRLRAWGLDVPLPIRGSGTFEVLYLDAALRVFRSGTSVSVQVRASELERLQQRRQEA